MADDTNPNTVSSLKERYDEMEKHNAQLRDAIKREGIFSGDDLAKRRPEYAQAVKKTSVAMLAISWTTAISGLMGAAIPLIFAKKIANNWPLRILSAIFYGLGAAFIGASASTAIFFKRLVKDSMEFEKLENRALQQEIGRSAQPPISLTQPPVLTSPAPPESKTFTAVIPPREPSFTAQAAKDAAQPSVAAAPGP